MEIKILLLSCYLTLWIIIEIKHYFLYKHITENHEEIYKLYKDLIENNKINFNEIQRKLISDSDYMAGQFTHISELNYTLSLQNAELKQQIENIAKELEMIKTGETKVLTV